MAGNGGKRPGAGRKPSTIKGVAARLPKDTAGLILATIKENQLWGDLLTNSDPRIRLDALKYLTDRRDGRAKQAVDMNHSGSGIVVLHTSIPRPVR
jgi:hypothetical protein